MNKPIARSKLQDQIAPRLARLRAGFNSGRTRAHAWRYEQLFRIEAMLTEREDEFAAALFKDLGKSPGDAFTTEIGFVKAEARLARKRLRRWMRPRRVGTPMLALPARSKIVPEPLGVALIIGPWNYPIQLVLAPLVGAIAAGNCAVVKPSEIATHSAAALARYLPDYLDPDCITVIEGGVSETEALLAVRWDKIFYTGGGRVGRIVMAAAAKHLTPVTLELGGKSPAIVLEDANIEAAARRIVWGRFLNTGQTCVSPDYVLVAPGREPALLEAMKAVLTHFFGADPRTSPDFGRIINDHHFNRLTAMLEDGEVVAGGQIDKNSRYIAPTILRKVSPEAPVMQEEIFGPILPVLTMASLNEAIAFVDARPKPLALYLFSRSREAARRVIAETSAGGVTINDTVLHLAVPGLPFGGVGDSGTGAYHGIHGFRAFSHDKAVLNKPSWPDPPLRYPPGSRFKRRWLRRIL
ncbi:MAG: aldehyde dehydrogenase family protein [Alphaproteobacteria bacterium]|nr:aldehyde dehydrogenase family protein [Alphaproteobacteria bacterium]